MNLNDIARLRLFNQQLIQHEMKSIEELVRWMGAMQAQDFGMVKWAIGIRIPESTEQLVEEALKRGEIIRTHLMRPTWHVVSSADVHWILELTAPHIKTQMRSRHKQLGLTEKVIRKSKNIIEKALQNGVHLTRDEIGLQLRKAGLVTENAQVTHIMAICELDRLICSGEQKGKNQTYALLEERVPKPHSISRDEALFKLAERYFRSHGPATIQDFKWWSGLPVRDARKGLESVKSQFDNAIVGEQEYWFRDTGNAAPGKHESVHLLPAFDEFIISYRDRTATLIVDHHQKAISTNGFFWPVLLLNGKSIGNWKRIQEKNRTVIEIRYFETDKLPRKSLLKNASEQYGSFLETDTEILIGSRPA